MYDTAGGEKTLAIVTGGNGAVGKAYLQEFSAMPNIRPVCLTRQEHVDEIPGVEYRYGVDLVEEHLVRQAIYSLCCEEADNILLIHPVGKFKFEGQAPQEIDQEVWLSNVETMVNVVRAVMARTRNNLMVCAFGSVSDKYNVPFWTSYTAAKNKVRDSLQNLAIMHQRPGQAAVVRSAIVNVSTTDTGNENQLRPNADKAFWLSPKKIVDTSLPTLLANSGPVYQEIDVIEERPGFDPAAYYGNPDAILQKWRQEMTQSSS